MGETVTSSGADLPAGIGGRQCTWIGGDGRALVVEVRVDADLDPMLGSAGETARSVLDQTVATQSDKLTSVADLGGSAFVGDGHVYVSARTATLVLDDQAGLSTAAEVTLARSATARL